MKDRGFNMANVSDRAKSCGYTLHKTTIKNILDGEQNFRIETLDALSAVFNIEPAFLIWGPGFNEKGKAIGTDVNIPTSTIQWSVKKVRLMLDDLEIDDLEFESLVLSSVIRVAATESKEKAEVEFARKLMEYNAK